MTRKPAPAQPSLSPLPDASVGEVLGLLEVISDKSGLLDAKSIAAQLLTPGQKIISVLAACEFLGLSQSENGKVSLTSLGKSIVLMKVAEKKAALAGILKNKPSLFKLVTDKIEQSGNEMKKEALIRFISDSLPNQDPFLQSEIILSLGRFSGILGYNEKKSKFYLFKEA